MNHNSNLAFLVIDSFFLQLALPQGLSQTLCLYYFFANPTTTIDAFCGEGYILMRPKTEAPEIRDDYAFVLGARPEFI